MRWFVPTDCYNPNSDVLIFNLNFNTFQLQYLFSGELTSAAFKIKLTEQTLKKLMLEFFVYLFFMVNFLVLTVELKNTLCSHS